MVFRRKGMIKLILNSNLILRLQSPPVELLPLNVEGWAVPRPRCLTLHLGKLRNELALAGCLLLVCFGPLLSVGNALLFATQGVNLTRNSVEVGFLLVLLPGSPVHDV